MKSEDDMKERQECGEEFFASTVFYRILLSYQVGIVEKVPNRFPSSCVSSNSEKPAPDYKFLKIIYNFISFHGPISILNERSDSKSFRSR